MNLLTNQSNDCMSTLPSRPSLKWTRSEKQVSTYLRTTSLIYTNDFFANLVRLVLVSCGFSLRINDRLQSFVTVCVWVPQLYCVPTLNLKIIKSLWGRNQMCRACWETNELTGAAGFLSRTVGSFTTQKKPRTHTQLSQKTINRKQEPMLWEHLNRIVNKNSAIIFYCGISFMNFKDSSYLIFLKYLASFAFYIYEQSLGISIVIVNYN